MMSCGIEKADGLLSLPELKFWARGCKEQFATDMVPYATLAGLLAESMNTRKTMSRILAARRAAQRAARGTGQRSVAAGYYDGGGHDFG